MTKHKNTHFCFAYKPLETESEPEHKPNVSVDAAAGDVVDTEEHGEEVGEEQDSLLPAPSSAGSKKKNRVKKSKHGKLRAAASIATSVSVSETESGAAMRSESDSQCATATMTTCAAVGADVATTMSVSERYHILSEARLTRAPSPAVIVIDNFYTDAMEMRAIALRQEFKVRGNYPGVRTRSFATEAIRNKFQEFVAPFGGRITMFPIPKPDGSDADQIYNGSFQITTSRDRSWIHTDHMNNWAGVIYCTPNAPLSSGTGFFEFCDGTRSTKDIELLQNRKLTDDASQDMTKWTVCDVIGNVFNRLALFNATNFHMSMDYFGNTLEDGRLFQVFFFSTEY